MSTQTAALPDGTKLTKPASGEKVSLSVINTNTDNIANNIIALNPKKNSISSIDNDSTILNLAAGVYMVALSNASSYFPERWGTLIIDRSNSTYGCVTFNSTTGKTYTRHMNGTASWHDDWQQLALNSNIEGFRRTSLNVANNGGTGTVDGVANGSTIIVTYANAASVYGNFVLCVMGGDIVTISSTVQGGTVSLSFSYSSSTRVLTITNAGSWGSTPHILIY